MYFWSSGFNDSTPSVRTKWNDSVVEVSSFFFFFFSFFVSFCFSHCGKLSSLFNVLADGKAILLDCSQDKEILRD